MDFLKFDTDSPFLPLYNEFLCSTEYVHYVKNRLDKNRKKDPYTPSLFIYSYFTFNTLYNINWMLTSLKRYWKLYDYRPWLDHENRKHYYSEQEKIEFYLEFLNKVYHENFFGEFRDNFKTCVTNYRVLYDERHGRKKDDSFYNESHASWVIQHLKQFKFKNYTNLDKTAKDDLLDIVGSVVDCNVGYLPNENFKRLLEIVYHVRCNLFHGSKDPWNFDESQEERFVIYAAILSSLNYMLFLHLSTLNIRKPYKRF